MKCSSAAVRLEHAAAHAGQSGDRHAAHGVVATCRNTSSAASSSCVPTFGPVASMRPGTPQPSSSCWCGGCARPGPRWASSSEAIRGCCRQLLINWCERAGVHYIIGPARNPKLEAIVECAQLALHEQHERTGTKLANTQIDALRIRLLKLAAVVTRNARRIRLYFASKWPSAATFAQAMRALNSAWHFILCLTRALTPTRPATQAGGGGNRAPATAIAPQTSIHGRTRWSSRPRWAQKCGPRLYSPTTVRYAGWRLEA